MFIGIVAILTVVAIIMVLSYFTGSLEGEKIESRNEQLVLEEEAHERMLRRELEHKNKIIEQADYLIESQKQRDFSEQQYLKQLMVERNRVEQEIIAMEKSKLPTREQMDNWVFAMQAENKMSNKASNQIMRLYDTRHIYPRVDKEG